MNRREFIKGAFGLAVCLILPENKPYFTILDEGWIGNFYAGESFTMDLIFNQKSMNDMEFMVTNTKIHGNEVTITVEEIQS